MSEKAKTITLIIPVANLTKIYHAEKKDTDYITITDGENELNMSVKGMDVERLKPLILKPLRFELEITAFVWQKSQLLSCVGLKSSPIQ